LELTSFPLNATKPVALVWLRNWPNVSV